MADQTSSDLLMRFIRRDGDRTVWAESMLDILPAKEDSFVEGFVPASSLDDYSNFFEISSFGISLGAKPGQNKDGHQVHDSKKPVAAGTPRAAGAEWNTFFRWATQRSSRSGQLSKSESPPDILVDFDQFSFSRIIDGASPDFFQACCDQVTFEEAILVKRVSTGLQGGDKRLSMGYLKFVFSDVLLISFGWEDGELITENCAFICKKMVLNYRQQDADGRLNAAVGELTWEQRTDDRIRLGRTVNRNGNG
jgi:type VI protein secretion system component Hcp